MLSHPLSASAPSLEPIVFGRLSCTLTTRSVAFERRPRQLPHKNMVLKRKTAAWISRRLALKRRTAPRRRISRRMRKSQSPCIISVASKARLDHWFPAASATQKNKSHSALADTLQHECWSLTQSPRQPFQRPVQHCCGAFSVDMVAHSPIVPKRGKARVVQKRPASRLSGSQFPMSEALPDTKAEDSGKIRSSGTEASLIFYRRQTRASSPC